MHNRSIISVKSFVNQTLLSCNQMYVFKLSHCEKLLNFDLESISSKIKYDDIVDNTQLRASDFSF